MQATTTTSNTPIELLNVPTMEEQKRRLSTGTASTDSTASFSSSASHKPRLVSFAEAPSVHLYPEQYCKEDKASHWYGKAEIKAMVDAEKEAVLQYMKDQPIYVTWLLKIWGTPCTQDEVLTRLITPIQASPMRGLEKHCLKSMKQRRGVVLKKVLQAQNDLYRHVSDPHERAHLLREECQPLSRTSARFARAMALGDAMPF